MVWPFSNTKPLKESFDIACAADVINRNDPNAMIDRDSRRDVSNAVNVLETTNKPLAAEIRQTCAIKPGGP